MMKQSVGKVPEGESMVIQGVSINPATVLTGHVVRQFLFLETTLGPMSFDLESYEAASAALRNLMQENEE